MINPAKLGASAPALSVARLTTAELAARRDDWQALADRALEPNVFYSPAFAEPAAAVFGKGLVWMAISTPDGALAGLFPMVTERWRSGGLLPLVAMWVTPYAPVSTPLIDASLTRDVIGRWLDMLAAGDLGGRIALLPLHHGCGAFATLLHEEAAQRRLLIESRQSHERAALIGQPDIDSALSQKRRKEIARLGRRLAERGALTHHVAAAPDEVAQAFATHASLEYLGWKGRAGTSFLNLPAHREAAAQALSGLSARGQVRIDRLDLDGRPIATGITLKAGRRAWFWKIAHDERLARYSPGVQLTLAMTKSLLATGEVDLVDSCAKPDHPMIDALWPDRMTYADLFVASGKAAAPALALTLRMEALRDAARSTLKGWRDRVRAGNQPSMAEASSKADNAKGSERAQSLENAKSPA
jgi:CelD/BcsL family acetyltransferase involved in cellulose biosynthesis